MTFKVFDVDQRPPKFGWASGNYTNVCLQCGKFFNGDKRAVHCAPCAYEDKATLNPKE